MSMPEWKRLAPVIGWMRQPKGEVMTPAVGLMNVGCAKTTAGRSRRSSRNKEIFLVMDTLLSKVRNTEGKPLVRGAEFVVQYCYTEETEE